MDRQSNNAETSDTESLPYSGTDSDTNSLVESIGSFDIESRDTSSKPAVFPKQRKDKKQGPQFLQFSIDLHGVPVSATWEFVRDPRNVAKLAHGKGILEYFEYLEGEGSTGSVFMGHYAMKFCEQFSLFEDSTEDRYLIHKVEVKDDNSRMYGVRCVGGRYQKRYKLYFMFIKVISHEILGERSSTIVWRLQYEVRDQSMPPPLETKVAYLAALDNVKDLHEIIYRVQRPVISRAMSATITKRLKVLRYRQACQQIVSDEVQYLSEKKSDSIVHLVGRDNNKDDQDCKGRQISRGKTTVQTQGTDGNGFKRQRLSSSCTQQIQGRTEWGSCSKNC